MRTRKPYSLFKRKVEKKRLCDGGSHLAPLLKKIGMNLSVKRRDPFR